MRTFVVLDRDGTVIVERNHLSDPGQVELLPGAARGLRKMRQMGLGLAIITNQSVIGRGLVNEAQLHQIHERMRKLLELEGVVLDGLYLCPHLPEDRCGCRKPGTGLLLLASRELGFDPSKCFVVGDKDCDIAMGQRAGATTLLVLTGYGEKTRDENKTLPDFVTRGLDDAATLIGRLVRQAESSHLHPTA